MSDNPGTRRRFRVAKFFSSMTSYRSGATMNAITAALYDEGAAADVFALTITRTRSNQ